MVEYNYFIQSYNPPSQTVHPVAVFQLRAERWEDRPTIAELRVAFPSEANTLFELPHDNLFVFAAAA